MKRALIIPLVFLSLITKAQFPGSGKDMAKVMKDIRGRVYGKLIDAKTKKPIEYASVVVLWFNKDSLIGGSLTGANGEFNIEGLPPMGGFRLRATQLGYKTFETKFYLQMPAKLELDLGDIPCQLDEKLLGEVDVVTEKNTVVMNIDKRTYNVDKDMSVKGGTAADVMKNVPGVTVDADGNAQLRNQSPMIFVDGRPTNLTLQQIPADQIERIEVITNPSVKFDAGATGGILNIIMKKNLKPGYNGMVMAYIGTGDRYGGMANINVKEGKWNFSGMFSYNQAINQTEGYTRRTQLDTLGNPYLYFNQDNNTRMMNVFKFGKLGIDYTINNRNTISLNTMIMSGKYNTNDRQDFSASNSDFEDLGYGDRKNDQRAAFQNYNTQLLYKKTYPKAGKELTADFSFNYNNSDNGFLFTTTSYTGAAVAQPDLFQENIGMSNARQGVFQLDYTNPISETKKFEAGLKSFYKNSLSVNSASSAVASLDFLVGDTNLSNRYIIDDIINAAYVNYNAQTFWNINYQAGLRFEQSYYRGTITDRQRSFSYQYPSGGEDLLKSLFPGIYFSKKFNNNQELQLNFSRKIQRPNFFQLMPFVMFADRQNYRIGNPELRPEFRNIAELNYNKTLTKGSYLGSGYFRYEEQPITDVAYPSLADPTVLVNTSINGRNALRYGMEHTFKYTLIKNLDATFNANVFYIFIKGIVVASEPEITAKGYAFNAKAILSYKLPKSFNLQINGNYESPRILLLGNSLPLYSMDITISKSISTKWMINATLSDVFNSRRMGTNYQTPYYIQELSRRREGRYFRISVTHMFGKMDASIFKKAKQQRGTDQQGSQDGLDFGR